jgi:hypothetical protein
LTDSFVITPMAFVSRSRVMRELKSSVAADGAEATGGGTGAFGTACGACLVGSAGTAGGGFDAVAGGAGAVGAVRGGVGAGGVGAAAVGAVGVGVVCDFGAAAAAGWSDFEGAGAGAGAAAVGGARAGAGAGVGAGAGAGADPGAGAVAGADAVGGAVGTGDEACAGAADGTGSSVGALFTATQPAAARQHSAIALPTICTRSIIGLPATMRNLISECCQNNAGAAVVAASSALDPSPSADDERAFGTAAD